MLRSHKYHMHAHAHYTIQCIEHKVRFIQKLHRIILTDHCFSMPIVEQKRINNRKLKRSLLNTENDYHDLL